MRSGIVSSLALFAVGAVAGALGHRQWTAHTRAAPLSGDTASLEAPATPPRYAPLPPAAIARAPEGNGEAEAFPSERPPRGDRPEFTRSWPSNEMPPWARGDWTNREAWIAQRAEEMRARASEQRSNFVAQAALSEEQSTRFDVLVEAMNMRLEDKVREWSALMEEGVLPRPESRARAMNEISEILVMTYDELDRNMPEGWRDGAGTNFSLNTFIDPDLVREMRPLMRGGFRGGPPPGGGMPPGPGR